jgi:DNA-binding transcriptional ArsR family regulator
LLAPPRQTVATTNLDPSLPLGMTIFVDCLERFPTLTSVDFQAIHNHLMTNHSASLDRSLHAISDSTRLRILEVLKRPEKSRTDRASHSFIKPSPERRSGLCAGDIEERVKVSQPTISHHMAILTAAGLVEAVKEGQWRWYRRNEKAIQGMIRELRAKI